MSPRLKAAMRAADDIYTDKSFSPATKLSLLDELREHIDTIIEAVIDDIEAVKEE